MEDAVALVPGFLGFEHDGELTYFADRFVAALRTSLEARTGQRVRVLALPTLPIGSLAKRQQGLLKCLTRLTERSEDPVRWHLVGHSTGGVDAAMLLRTQALADGPDGSVFGGPLDTGIVRVASAVTISAPHHGTGLAREVESRLAKLGHGAKLFFDVLRDVRQGDFKARLAFAMAAKASPVDLMLHDALARDLLPTVATALTRTPNRGPGPLWSIATCVPDVPTDDHMFTDLYAWTSNHVDAPAPVTVPAGVPWISAKGPLAVDERSNDGVVTTLRQIDGQLAAFVAGDHADVIGRYRRKSAFDGELVEPGLLTSGAEFDDDQFFEMIAAVAACLARAFKT